MRIERSIWPRGASARLPCLSKGACLQCVSRGASVRLQCLSKKACLQCSRLFWFAEDSGRSGPLWPKHQHTRAHSAHSRGYWQTFYACYEKHETLLLERAPSASEIKEECTSSSRSIRRAHIHRIADPQPENTVHGGAPPASPAADLRAPLCPTP